MRRYPTTMDYIKDFVKGGLFLCAWVFGVIVVGVLFTATFISIFGNEHSGVILTFIVIFIFGGLIRISSEWG